MLTKVFIYNYYHYNVLRRTMSLLKKQYIFVNKKYLVFLLKYLFLIKIHIEDNKNVVEN